MSIQRVGGLEGIGRQLGTAVTLHTVRRGETLGSIAKAFHLGRATLASANPQLRGEEPKAGTRLTIPLGGQAPSRGPKSTDSFERSAQVAAPLTGRRLEIRKDTLATLTSQTAPATERFTTHGCGELANPAVAGRVAPDARPVDSPAAFRFGDRLTYAYRVGDAMTDPWRGGVAAAEQAMGVTGGLDLPTERPSVPVHQLGGAAETSAYTPEQAFGDLTVRKDTIAGLVNEVAMRWAVVGTTSR